MAGPRWPARRLASLLIPLLVLIGAPGASGGGAPSKAKRRVVAQPPGGHGTGTLMTLYFLNQSPLFAQRFPDAVCNDGSPGTRGATILLVPDTPRLRRGSQGSTETPPFPTTEDEDSQARYASARVQAGSTTQTRRTPPKPTYGLSTSRRARARERTQSLSLSVSNCVSFRAAASIRPPAATAQPNQPPTPPRGGEFPARKRPPSCPRRGATGAFPRRRAPSACGRTLPSPAARWPAAAGRGGRGLSACRRGYDLRIDPRGRTRAYPTPDGTEGVAFACALSSLHCCVPSTLAGLHLTSLRLCCTFHRSHPLSRVLLLSVQYPLPILI